MNDRLDISEIFLKGPLNPNQKKKKKKKKKNTSVGSILSKNEGYSVLEYRKPKNRTRCEPILQRLKTFLW